MVARIKLEDVTYNSKTGRYHSPSKGFLSKSDLEQILNVESTRLATRLERISNRLIAGKLSLAEWERAFYLELKYAAIISVEIGAGGRDQVNSKQWGLVGAELKRQKKYLRRFAGQVANGKLSVSQIRARSKLYSTSAIIPFGQSEKIAKTRENFKSAKRDTDPEAQHCIDCPLHSTNGLWLPIRQVTPKGTNCRCGGHCRCRVKYSKLAPGQLNIRGVLG